MKHSQAMCVQACMRAQLDAQTQRTSGRSDQEGSQAACMQALTCEFVRLFAARSLLQRCFPVLIYAHASMERRAFSNSGHQSASCT